MYIHTYYYILPMYIGVACFVNLSLLQFFDICSVFILGNIALKNEKGGIFL